MNLGPLNIKRSRWQSFVSVLPYLVVGYVIAVVVIAIVASWFQGGPHFSD